MARTSPLRGVRPGSDGSTSTNRRSVRAANGQTDSWRAKTAPNGLSGLSTAG